MADKLEGEEVMCIKEYEEIFTLCMLNALYIFNDSYISHFTVNNVNIRH
jgi:hypothetical protein